MVHANFALRTSDVEIQENKDFLSWLEQCIYWHNQQKPPATF